MTEHRDGATGRADATSVGPPLLEALSLLLTAAAIAWLPWLTREGRWPITLLVIAALVAGSAGVIADLITLPARSRTGAPGSVVGTAAHPAPPEARRRSGTASRHRSSFTTIVTLGDEPAELQRHSVELAALAGPCIVVAPDGLDLPDGLDATVVDGRQQALPAAVAAQRADDLGDDHRTKVRRAEHRCTDDAPVSLLEQAVALVQTDAVLLLSGRAAPIPQACRAAAALLDDDHPWAVGRTRLFNADGFAPDSRDRVDTELRRRASSVDLALWEPNATLVRTADLRNDPMTSRCPRGSWLRRRQASGSRALVCDDAFAFVASPAGPRTFWPESIAQSRGAAADASAGARSSHGLARCAALALTVRSCSAWSLVTWLMVLFTGTMSGELPFRTAHGALIALIGGALALRWAGLMLSVGGTPRPMRDLRSAVDRIPGSLGALRSAFTARVRPTPRRVSVRPLLWAGLLSAAVLATALVDHSPDTQMTPPAVAAALCTLVLLWLICIQVLVQRGWERTAFRVPLSLSVTMLGRVGETIDASPEGVAIELPLPGSAPSATLLAATATAGSAQERAATSEDATEHDATERDVTAQTTTTPSATVGSSPEQAAAEPVAAERAAGRSNSAAVELDRTRGVQAPMHPGDVVSVSIELDDQTTRQVAATIAWTRRTQRRDLVGLRLDLDASNRSAWAAQLLRAVSSPATDRPRNDEPPTRAARPRLAIDTPTTTSGTIATEPAATPGSEAAETADRELADTRRARPGRSRTARAPMATGAGPTFATRCFDVAGLVLTVGLSMLLLAVLGGAMLNLQAAVVRSGSMTPTIAQGAVVISESVPVASLRPGDVITRPAEGSNGTVTHRLVSATREGDQYRMQTRGDANETSETWTIPADARLQRVRWVVPSVGDAVSLLRSNVAIAVGAVVVVGLLIAALRIPRRRTGSHVGQHATPT